MENNDDLCSYGISKKRKIDNNKDSENVADKSDESLNIEGKNVIADNGDAKESSSGIVIIAVESDKEDIDVEAKINGGENFATNHISMIPITDLQEKNSHQQNNDDEIKQLPEESIGCNCLSEKVGQLEDEIIKRVRSEILQMRKNWEESSCKCRFEMNVGFGKFMLVINQLKKENAQYKVDKELLMKEKDQLKEKLEKEQEFRLRLSGMLKQDGNLNNESTTSKATESSKTNEQQGDNISNTSRNSQSSETDRVKKSASTRHTIHGYSTGHFAKSENNKSPQLSVRDRMPKKIPSENLIYDEIEQRKKRRCNMIVKGMRQRKGRLLFEDVLGLIKKRTGIWPWVFSLRIIETGLLLEMKSYANKIEIMKCENALKSMNITLEHDLTDRERQVQNWLIEVAREDAKLGKQTVVGYLTIKQDGVWKVWDEYLGNLVVDKTKSATRDGVAVCTRP